MLVTSAVAAAKSELQCMALSGQLDPRPCMGAAGIVVHQGHSAVVHAEQ
jgi:hypothetical protein